MLCNKPPLYLALQLIAISCLAACSPGRAGGGAEDSWKMHIIDNKSFIDEIENLYCDSKI